MQTSIRTPESVEEITALRNLFEEYLKLAYWSEKALSGVIEDLIQAVNSPEVKKIFTQHAVNSRIHADRIDRIFESIGIPAEEKQFEAIESLLNEIDSVRGSIPSGVVRDAAIIAIVQHVIHSEIATYGTLRAFAITLKEEEVVALLERNLDDEKGLDLRLSAIAQSYINDEAANKEF